MPPLMSQALSSIRSDGDRWLKTLVLLLGCVTHGMSSGATGPALIDLSHQVQASLASVSFLLTIMTIGYLLASLASQYLLLLS